MGECYGELSGSKIAIRHNRVQRFVPPLQWSSLKKLEMVKFRKEAKSKGK
jgi:hypothetical protein